IAGAVASKPLLPETAATGRSAWRSSRLNQSGTRVPSSLRDRSTLVGSACYRGEDRGQLVGLRNHGRVSGVERESLPGALGESLLNLERDGHVLRAPDIGD